MIQIHVCEDSEHQLKQIKKALGYACAIVSDQMQIVQPLQIGFKSGNRLLS